MQKKLTLSIDEELIKFAHDFSQKTNQPISRVVEKYLHQLKNQESNENVHAKIKNLYGFFENEPIPGKKELREMFHDKSDH